MPDFSYQSWLRKNMGATEGAGMAVIGDLVQSFEARCMERLREEVEPKIDAANAARLQAEAQRDAAIAAERAAQENAARVTDELLVERAARADASAASAEAMKAQAENAETYRTEVERLHAEIADAQAALAVAKALRAEEVAAHWETRALLDKPKVTIRETKAPTEIIFDVRHPDGLTSRVVARAKHD